jgi:hypothetical protein
LGAGQQWCEDAADETQVAVGRQVADGGGAGVHPEVTGELRGAGDEVGVGEHDAAERTGWVLDQCQGVGPDVRATPVVRVTVEAGSWTDDRGGLGVGGDVGSALVVVRRGGDRDDTGVEAAEQGGDVLGTGRKRHEHAMPGEPTPHEGDGDRLGTDLNARPLPDQVEEGRCPCHTGPLLARVWLEQEIAACSNSTQDEVEGTCVT